MNSVVRFNNVSKQHRIGLTRTSLPSMLSKWVRGSLRRSGVQVTQTEYFWALQDISFELGQGKSLALVGPNGAGKTTILKLLAKITKPTSGLIETNGRLSALIELGAGFHPDMTGRENVYLNGTILGLSRQEIDQRFDEIVAFSELDRFIDTPLKRYSSGMAVRLGFSVAAFVEPEILLIDEVLAVGDASFRAKCIERINQMLAQGTSIVFVSHNLWLVQSVCESALYIDKGRLLLQGSTREVIEAYDRDIHLQRASKLELADPEVAGSLGGVDVSKVEVFSLGENAGDEISNKEPAEVRARYMAYKDIGVANVVIRIVRSDGLTCCMMRTNLDDYPVYLNRGEGVISVILDPLQLYGGAYFAQVDFQDESDSWSLGSRWSEVFHVSGSPLSHQQMNGVFEPNRVWRHKQNVPDGGDRLKEGIAQ